MTHIRPVSDLRNKYREIEDIVKNGEPVFLTENGYTTMVLLSLEEYSNLTDDIETKLDEADFEAKNLNVRLTHEEVFESIRKTIHEI